MNRDAVSGRPTRRDCITAGAAAFGTGLLTGCSGLADPTDGDGSGDR